MTQVAEGKIEIIRRLGLTRRGMQNYTWLKLDFVENNSLNLLSGYAASPALHFNCSDCWIQCHTPRGK